MSEDDPKAQNLINNIWKGRLRRRPLQAVSIWTIDDITVGSTIYETASKSIAMLAKALQVVMLQGKLKKKEVVNQQVL